MEAQERLPLPCENCLALPICLNEAREINILNILFTYELEDKCSLIVEYIRDEKEYPGREKRQYKIIEFFKEAKK